jgi:benzodiazapine receptor
MRLAISIGVCLAVGWLGSLVTRPALRDWYAALSKPAWTPPSWVFAPVWTSLYLAMGVAAWLVWRHQPLASLPMRLFLVQLLLNFAWTAVFFGLRAPGWAVVEIAVLWVAILLTAVTFTETSTLAAGLMAPYLLWVAYAGALNFAIWRLNR